MGVTKERISHREQETVKAVGIYKLVKVEDKMIRVMPGEMKNKYSTDYKKKQNDGEGPKEKILIKPFIYI